MRGDFNELKSFFESYSVPVEPLGLMAGAHQKYYAFLYFSYNLIDGIESGRILSKGAKVDDLLILRYREIISDISESFFCVVNGAYKSALVLIRSSLENFLKFFCMLDSASPKAGASVSDFFEFAKSTGWGVEKKVASDLVHTMYGEICHYSHTNGEANMFSFSSVGNFPVFNSALVKKIANYLEKCCLVFIDVAIWKFPKLYIEAGVDLKDVIEINLSANDVVFLMKDGRQHMVLQGN